MSTNWNNIVDVYTNEITANKSSLEHYHYWNIYIAHMNSRIWSTIITEISQSHSHIFFQQVPLYHCPLYTVVDLPTFP